MAQLSDRRDIGHIVQCMGDGDPRKSRLRALDRMQSHGRSPAPRVNCVRTHQLPNVETDVVMAPQGPKEVGGR